MNLIDTLVAYLRGGKPSSASVAKERLQIVLAHEGGRGAPDYLPQLKQEILGVISKYVAIDPERLKVSFGHRSGYDLLEMNIVLQEAPRA